MASFIHPHDFELITAPDPEEVWISELPTETSTHRPASPTASIKSLFENVPNSRNETPLSQCLAKAIVLSILPLMLAWTTFSTIITLNHIAFKNDRSISDDKVLEQVAAFVLEDIEKCRQRLRRIDERMPEIVMRRQEQLNAFMIWLRSAFDRTHTPASSPELKEKVASVSKFAAVKSIIGLLVLASWIAPWAGWWWVAFGYLLKQEISRRIAGRSE
ncbi:uncharacterized protein LTR77_007743 [Saxophila tyrrhenica]|uniref:Uncharacterized protein n=1 Tax=Saxophila tyrrhenica TaxID=1690608 RepID=A0AAV9P302_9PEZI|nr:hypothetical protein LTR77_007743 [Saxophila tyrrhenica]